MEQTDKSKKILLKNVSSMLTAGAKHGAEMWAFFYSYHILYVNGDTCLLQD